MSLKTNKKILLAEIESVYGTDPTPTGASNAMLVRNLNVTPLNSEIVQRDLIRGYFGNSDSLLAMYEVQVEFEIELQASGTAGTAPAWGPVLKACGFGETINAGVSVVYAPISSSIASVTFYYNIDGVLHRVTGARGNVEIGMNVKQIPVLKFTFTGLYNTPTDTSAPVADFSAFKTPKIVNTANTPTFSLHSYSGYLEQMTLNMANDIQHRVLVGFEEVIISDRKPTGTFVIEAPTMTAKNFFDIAKNGTTGAMQIVHGSGAGYIVTIDAPKVSIQNPSYSDLQGVQMLNIPFVPVPNSGNDEVTITLT